MKDFFSVQEIAVLLKISKSSVLYYIKTKKLKAIRVGKIFIISRENFGIFLKEQRAKKKNNEENQPRFDFN